MKKCPYCSEVIEEKSSRCPSCFQFIIDTLIESDYRSIDKKKCIFCGKMIFQEARICKYCHKWLDAVDRAADDIEKME